MARALFWRLKANGQIVIGISSYQEFPGMITNPFDDRHVTEADMEIFGAVDGWLHCFRSVIVTRVWQGSEVGGLPTEWPDIWGDLAGLQFVLRECLQLVSVLFNAHLRQGHQASATKRRCRN